MPALSLLTARSRIALAAASLCLAAPMIHAQEVQTVRIAHAGPTSGGIAHIGKDTENGVRHVLVRVVVAAVGAAIDLVRVRVHKILDVDIIFSMRYSKWVSNLVPVWKKNGDIRLCVDF